MTDVKKKKLLIIVPTLHQGGQEHVVIRSARLLADRMDVTIAIFDDSDIGYDVTGLDIVNLNVPALSGSVFKLINILKRRIKLADLKKKLKPDISYSYGPSADLINALTATEEESTWVGLRNYTDAADERRMTVYLRHADLVVCCARDIETYVRHKYGFERTAVLYNLYDIDAIKTLAENEEPEEALPLTDSKGRKLIYIASMGRDDDQKMFWHMLKSFKLIRTKVPEARLIILGDGTFDAYKRMAKGLGIEGDVIFPGRQDNPYKYLKYAQVNWMTSRNEGFPNALVEGMALGLTAVSTNCMTGPAEILTADRDVYTCTDELNETMEALLAAEMNKEDLGDPHVAAIYGEYGILTPAMTRERDMDFANITFEHYNLARIMVKLLRDDAMLEKYSVAAAARACDYGCDAYLKRFEELTGRYVKG